MSTLCKGLNLNNRYVLNEFIGQGSFGEVWLVFDEMLAEEVAIKLYSSLDPEGINEFKSEFYTTASIQHPNLLVAKQFSQWENRPFLVMKYCHAGSSSNFAGLIDEDSLWRFIADVSAGLAYLHELSEPIIHQDIKPDNILVGDDGEFIISDFGISRRLSRTMDHAPVGTHEGGAVAYMAPERFGEEPELLVASDVWSLGASIYELATGKLPFTGNGGSMLRNGAAMPHLPVPWSKNINHLMTACLDVDPNARPTARQINDYALAIINGVKEPPCTWEPQTALPLPEPAPKKTSKIKLEKIKKAPKPVIIPAATSALRSLALTLKNNSKKIISAAACLAALVVLALVAYRISQHPATDKPELIAQTDLETTDDTVQVEEDLNIDDEVDSPTQVQDPALDPAPDPAPEGQPTQNSPQKGNDNIAKPERQYTPDEEYDRSYMSNKDPNSIPSTRAALPLNGKSTQGNKYNNVTNSRTTNGYANKGEATTDKGAQLNNAIERGDYATVKQLADNGYSAAYGPLAMHYLKNRNYTDAANYGQKAKAAGSQQGSEVINYLEKAGYFD